MNAPGNASLAKRLRDAGALGPLHWHFAQSLQGLSAAPDPLVALATALTSRAVSSGHVCLDLARIVERQELGAEGQEAVAVEWPPLAAWVEALRGSDLVTEVGDTRTAEEVSTPLVLDTGRLYTRRYWLYETHLARDLVDRSTFAQPSLSDAEATALLDRLFGSAGGEVDRQRLAAAVALTRKLCVITGGPGTGKTHTVANLLVVLAENERRRNGRLPDVLVLAPTGKAANRLSESMAERAHRLDCADDVRALVATPASTIHRALRRAPRSRSLFRHDASHPLRADVVVVDEASMVDIALMSKLLSAVPADARVVLLGDRDQLASVEAGAILADICGDPGSDEYSAESAARIEAIAGHSVASSDRGAPVIRDSVVRLRRNYRYSERGGIGLLAAAINRGDDAAVLEILQAGESEGVSMRPGLEADAGLYRRALEAACGLVEASTPEAKLEALGAFRVLAALRRGPFGVEGLNREIEARARQDAGIDPDRESYPGRPLMILHNDPETNLFNGDVGVVDRIEEGVRAFFATDDEPRRLSLGRLPAHETVYAMTIHKSQGSEFDEVAVILPDRAAPILTRELLYTAVTRARSKVTIYADADILRTAVRQTVERSSGLAERLGWR